MFTPRRKDIKHKIELLRLLRAVLKNNYLAHRLMFKGGTYASLRGVLDRFSVELDFELPDNSDKAQIRKSLHSLFDSLSLEVKDESKKHLQFLLKYDAPERERNTIKVDINDTPSKYNEYEKVNLLEINMFCNGHTLETMFANKLIAAMTRFDKTGKIAGRDFYDILVFYKKGLEINEEVIKDLSGMSYLDYIEKLVTFVEDRVTNRLLNEDLNPLLTGSKLKVEIPNIKADLIVILDSEKKVLGLKPPPPFF